MNGREIIFGVICITIFTGCKEAYNPGILSGADSFLVVEGVLNAGSGPTTVKVSRTYKLDDSARLRGENGAQVSVEGRDNSVRQLSGTGNGTYTSSGLNLILNQEYRLKIVTREGKEYVSAFVVAKDTGPIDSLGFIQDEKGVMVYVNTHDDNNNTRYYLWNYEETWEINSFFISRYEYKNGQVIPRSQPENVTNCWKHNPSATIILASTASLQSDILHESRLLFINSGDERLAVRYSVLVRQHALDKKGFEFFSMMQRNTEKLGSLFDAQPSALMGNVSCTSDPEEPVVGYISASVIREKRFFVAKSQLPMGWDFVQDCTKTQIGNGEDDIKKAVGIGLGFIDDIRSSSGDKVGYTVARMPCLDCRRRGGSLEKPSYWP